MDIQRGDQVYYRGEVWTVQAVFLDPKHQAQVVIWRMKDERHSTSRHLYANEVQRVEQVR